MASISSLGIGSGLDANGIVTKLVELERQPLRTLQAKAVAIQARISAFGQIQSQFAGLNDALQRLAVPAAWTGRLASSSNTAAATISASSTAQAASFTLDVDVLAQAQSVSSQGLAPGASVGAGTLTLELGQWSADGSSFTPKSGQTAKSFTIGATDTLTDVVSKINAANAGVTATVFNDGSNNHLLIKANSAGAANGFRLQASDADGTDNDNAGLSRLAFDPATLDPLTSATFGMASVGQPVQYGVDARARINGLAVTSSSNTLTDNFSGVTINLLATTTTGYGTAGEVRAPVSMSVRTDTGVAVKNVQDFVTAYNTLQQTLSDMTKYDAATQTAGPFQGDSVIVGLQNMVSNLLSSSGNGVYRRLSDVGVAVQRDGSLAMDSVKLGAAANNGAALQEFFAAPASGGQGGGLALRLGRFMQGALKAGGGLLSNEAGALQRELAANGKQQDAVNQRAERMQERLAKQYSALDARMGQLSALNAYVSQQITLWNKAKSE